MPRLIAAAAAALITTMPAHALDLSGGTLRGASEQPDGAALEKLAGLDIAPPAPFAAEDELDAMVAEDAALAIEPADGFVPLDEPDVVNDAVDAVEDGDAIEAVDVAAEADDMLFGLLEDESADPDDDTSYDTPERFVEAIPVLAVPEAGFQAVLPTASTSVAVLPSGGWGGNEWGTNNPRPSTVVMGGSWRSR